MSIITASLLSLALVVTQPGPKAAPTVRHTTMPGCVTPDVTGTFRITTANTKGVQGVPAMLLLENIEGCLEVTFVTAEKGPAIIDHLSQAGELLKGRLNVTGSAAQVTLRFNGQSVAGSIIDGKQEWRIEGRKTS